MKVPKKLVQKGVKSQEVFFLSDDCAICRAMKEGRACTEEELRAAFAEAERQQRASRRQ